MKKETKKNFNLVINFSPAVNQENKGEVQNLKLTLNFLINRLEFYFIIDAFFAAHVRKSGQTVETLNFERETKKREKMKFVHVLLLDMIVSMSIESRQSDQRICPLLDSGLGLYFKRLGY